MTLSTNEIYRQLAEHATGADAGSDDEPMPVTDLVLIVRRSLTTLEQEASACVDSALTISPRQPAGPTNLASVAMCRRVGAATSSWAVVHILSRMDRISVCDAALWRHSMSDGEMSAAGEWSRVRAQSATWN